MRGWLTFAVGLAASASAQEIRTTMIASGITAPTDIQDPRDGSGRLFFVQQSGLVRIFRNGALVTRPFLDIHTKTVADGEKGLLGLAFPPGFAQKQRFYVDYDDPSGNTIIAMYRVTSDPDLADAASETVLMRIAQPFPNHKGGQVRFGPDGYLYIAMGDGGSQGDPMGNGQNRNVLLGKLLRLDVESDPGRVHIPPDNPFANVAGARPEIWAYGFRNPWRFSFDRATNDLWIGDVGQENYEEVDLQPAASKGGENYGWNMMEGFHCYNTKTCDTTGLTMPVAEYSHADGSCSMIGGFLYRGKASPGMRGLYLYGDLCSGKIWGLERQGSSFASRLLLGTKFMITTFGEDDAGELYVADAGAGGIYHIEGSVAPRVNASGIVNAASFAPGLSPGSLGTIFTAGVLDAPGVVNAAGIPVATSLAGVSVTVAGVSAPILQIANRNGQEQINFQVPYEARGRSTASVVVTRDGQASAPVDAPVTEIQPAIYTSDGSKAVVVHNSDFTLATPAKPLAAGEYAFVYATGLGRAANEPATGAAADAAPLPQLAGDVRLTLGGQPCEIEYVGLAPGFVGVYQVNFRVPAGAASGAQDLGIAESGTASPAVKADVR